MTTVIYSMEESTGEIAERAIYTTNPAQALMCFIEQSINHNFNTWEYPKFIDGMWPSTKAPGVWHYDDGNGHILMARERC